MKPKTAAILLLIFCISLIQAAPAQATTAADPSILSALSALASSSQLDPDPAIRELLAQVSTNTLYNYAGGLSGEWEVAIGGQPYTINTRYSHSAGAMEKVTQYVYEHFQALGLQVQYQDYMLSNVEQRRNVIAEQPGDSKPQCIYILSAHLDNTSQSAAYYASGADDNASGSTAVLAAADLLSRYSFQCTLRYALFTGEEQGLLGSQAYAKAARQRGDDIQGVLNLDMIAYNSAEKPQPVVELHTRKSSSSDLILAETFAGVVSAYDLHLVPEILRDGPYYSDHAGFWNQGYPAIIAIEDVTDPNSDTSPYYHTTGDQIETLDFTYFTHFVQAAIGTLAHLGGQSTGKISGVITSLNTGFPIGGVTISASLGDTGSYTTTSETDGSYLLELPERPDYTLEYREPWHAPIQISNFQVVGGETIHQDIQLWALPVFTVSGNVQDALTNQPLSATIKVLDLALLPVETDPATGSYSLSLPQGAHRLSASARDYFTQWLDIDLQGDVQKDFALFPKWYSFLPLIQGFFR